MTDTIERRTPKNLFVEFHVLRSFAPGNLNRDDLGTPKTAMFGGVRRLRISSQCIKRTWRTSDFFRGALARELLGIDVLGVRTKKLPMLVRQRLEKELPPEALDGMNELLQRIGRKDAEPKAGEKGTAHLLYLTSSEIEAVQSFVRENAEALGKLAHMRAADDQPAAAAAESSEAADDGKTKSAGSRGRSRKALRSKDREKLLEELQHGLKKHLEEQKPRNAVDVALFGRFVTGDEFPSVEAALQVAHALGTQKVEMEYDYYSAVDDLGEGPGAGHIGETEFAQSVLYQYAVCDFRTLIRNLEGHAERAKDLAAYAMRAITLAAAQAVPVGKVKGTAPQNPADYVEVVVRCDAPISLANAFLRPVRPTEERDVMDLSIARLRERALKYEAAYSREEDVFGRFVFSAAYELSGAKLHQEKTCKSPDELATKVCDLLLSAEV